MRNMETPWRNRIIAASAIVLLLLAWLAGARVTGNDFILPGPGMVLKQMAELLMLPDFYINLLVTILRGLLGFVISLVFASLLGFAAAVWPSFRHAVFPLLTAMRSTPVISFILLALIWVGSDRVPVFIAFLTMFPILCSSILDGIKNTDRELIMMAQSFRVPQSRIFTGIFLPSLAPFFFSGLTNAMGFGWRAIIIGEVLSQPVFGIGSRMKDAQNYLMVSTLIAWTVFAILVSSLFEFLARKLEKKTVHWRNLHE
ncbi:MAG: ABC transporter permease subunit [Bacteroidales bacterium]